MRDERLAASCLRRRQMLVGRVKRMLDAGKTICEISNELKLTESTVRPIVAMIRENERYLKSAMETTNE